MPRNAQTILATLSLLILGTNTLNSLSVTFSAHRRELPLDVPAHAPLATHASHSHKITVIIERPRREDVAELCQLFIQHFGYIYTAIFDTSVRLTYRIVKSVLVSGRGRHLLGYKAFHIARGPESHEILGFLVVITADSNRFFPQSGAVIRAALVTIRYLGIVGLVRTFRNLRKLGSLVSTTASDELYILYVAVRPTARHHQVGSQLIAFANSLAAEQQMRLLTLEVREANNSAQQFFTALGFANTHVIHSPGDEILGRGGRIRMTRKVEP
jgi:ribosomal protein S18 acetylase RimI-like enzyme